MALPSDLPAGFDEKFLDTAHKIADAAAKVTRKYFR
jgi:hypothetical protein